MKSLMERLVDAGFSWTTEERNAIVETVHEWMDDNNLRADRKIGCVACWLDPNVAGHHINSVNVVFDGNGYCTAHWRDAVAFIQRQARRMEGKSNSYPANYSLPLVLAGIAKEVE